MEPGGPTPSSPPVAKPGAGVGASPAGSLRPTTLLLLVLVLLLAAATLWLGWANPTDVRDLTPAGATLRLDINAASAADLSALPGVGPTLAHRIVAEREQAGPFRQVDDLQRVKGVGEVTLDRIRPWVVCGPASSQ